MTCVICVSRSVPQTGQWAASKLTSEMGLQHLFDGLAFGHSRPRINSWSSSITVSGPRSARAVRSSSSMVAVSARAGSSVTLAEGPVALAVRAGAVAGGVHLVDHAVKVDHLARLDRHAVDELRALPGTACAPMIEAMVGVVGTLPSRTFWRASNGQE